jgi:hypothetical protein
MMHSLATESITCSKIKKIMAIKIGEMSKTT